MSEDSLPVTKFAPMMRELHREAMRNKSYRRYPVGEEVGRYLRALRFADAEGTTLEAYEQVLSRLALDHGDFVSLEAFAPPVGTEYIREFLERHWGDAASSTRSHRLSIVRSFFKWAHEEGRISANPTLTIKGPRRKSRERQAYPAATILQLVRAQPALRDQCALQLFARLGLRKNELRLVQLRDVDLARNLIVIRHGKGGRQAVLRSPSRRSGTTSTCTSRSSARTQAPSTCSTRKRTGRAR
jgi:site-specific recombinase XerC